jgi:hypothetical protein
MKRRSLLFYMFAIAAGLAALLLTAGCGEQAVTDSGVQGEVRIGPVAPVEQPGVPNDKPYAATLQILRASDGKIVAEARSGADGSFRVALAPGRYVLQPESGQPLPTAPSQEFTVSAGQFTPVRVDYDSGIR